MNYASPHIPHVVTAVHEFKILIDLMLVISVKVCVNIFSNLNLGLNLI